MRKVGPLTPSSWPDEIGMYDDDPLGRIGYSHFQLFRANRCVVDTGIHSLKWTRDQAIRYFVENGGNAPSFAGREVERYCATPGQACSYKIGHTVWTKARERTKAALGARYNIKDFHSAGLDCGRVPLDVLGCRHRSPYRAGESGVNCGGYRCAFAGRCPSEDAAGMAGPSKGERAGTVAACIRTVQCTKY